MCDPAGCIVFPGCRHRRLWMYLVPLSESRNAADMRRVSLHCGRRTVRVAAGAAHAREIQWRRGRDSNPGCRKRHNGFRGRRLQPLGHLSTARRCNDSRRSQTPATARGVGITADPYCKCNTRRFGMKLLLVAMAEPIGPPRMGPLGLARRRRPNRRAPDASPKKAASSSSSVHCLCEEHRNRKESRCRTAILHQLNVARSMRCSIKEEVERR